MSTAKRIGILRRELLEMPRRRFIIPNVLPVGTNFWYGDNSVGKTGLAIRTAVALSAGLRWADRDVSRGCVLYVVGEDYPGVAERLSATIEHLHLSPDDLPIAVMPCPDKGVVDKSARQEVANEANALMLETHLPLSLIVFDTLATCFGDDNQDDATAAGKFMKNCERLARDFECAVLTIHHIGHRGKEMRGSSVFRKAADAVCFLERPKGKPTIAEVTKLRGAPEGYRLAFDIAGVNLAVAGGDISVQVVKNLNEWTEAEKPSSAQEAVAKRDLTDKAVAMMLLREITLNGVASLKAWQEACFRHWSNKSGGARRTAFTNAHKKLANDGLITISGDTVSVSVSENPANSAPNNRSPDTVSVSVSTPPFRGVHERTNRPDKDPPMPKPKIEREARTGTDG